MDDLDRLRSPIRLFVLLTALVLVAAACGRSDETDAATNAGATDDDASTTGAADESVTTERNAQNDDPTTSSSGQVAAPSATSTPTTTATTASATTATSTSTTKKASPTTKATTATTSGAGTEGAGVVAIRLEQIDGVFIEGFEIGLRFETKTQEVLASTLWSDFVRSQSDSGIDPYYTSVLEQLVPAGAVVVLATVNIGMGPGPVVPDLQGPMRCRLDLLVPGNGRVDVEVSFDRTNCLRQL